MNKPRFDSALGRLSEDQQAQVYDWLQTLGYTRTIEKLAEPAPDGFGLRTYRASLHRFFVRYSLELKQSDISDATELVSRPQSAPLLQSGAAEAMHQAAFQLATSPHDLGSFTQLSRWLTKQQYLKIAQEHLALARERLALERERFQFNAARQALLKLPELTRIMDAPAHDDEDRIWAARDQLFGDNLNPRCDLDPQPPGPSSENPKTTESTE